jgi:uncharacterized protein (DUF488 family)
MSSTIWTIGHSTRTLETFIALLKAHAIGAIADVRAFPSSRRHPQFNLDALENALQQVGIQYHHVSALGGRRKSRPDSMNQGWRNSSFRGYADYMQTAQFKEGLARLLSFAAGQPTAIMCAEAMPWRCHRSLIADALLSRGWSVRHILTPAKADLHALTSFAQMEGGVLFYPSPSPQGPSLF